MRSIGNDTSCLGLCRVSSDMLRLQPCGLRNIRTDGPQKFLKVSHVVEWVEFPEADANAALETKVNQGRTTVFEGFLWPNTADGGCVISVAILIFNRKIADVEVETH